MSCPTDMYDIQEEITHRVELEYRLFLSIDSSLYRPKTIFCRRWTVSVTAARFSSHNIQRFGLHSADRGIWCSATSSTVSGVDLNSGVGQPSGYGTGEVASFFDAEAGYWCG